VVYPVERKDHGVEALVGKTFQMGGVADFKVLIRVFRNARLDHCFGEVDANITVG
jgi:hypothetical protein